MTEKPEGDSQLPNPDGSAPRSYAPRLARELRALGAAAIAAIAVLMAVPGNWLLAVDDVEFVYVLGETPLVIQRATPRVPLQKSVFYSVEIVELSSALDHDGYDTIICRVVSHWNLDAWEPTELRITLRAWLDAPACRLHDDRLYFVNLTIFFDFFGFTKSVQRRSAALTIMTIE